MANLEGKLQSLGKTIDKMGLKMIGNQTLCKLLYYSGEHPLSQPNIEAPELLIHKNILSIPKITTEPEETGAIVSIIFDEINIDPINSEFQITAIKFLVLMSPNQWAIKETTLRPYLIMEQLVVLFNGARLEGIGTLKLVNIKMTTPTETYSGYVMTYVVSDFN